MVSRLWLNGVRSGAFVVILLLLMCLGLVACDSREAQEVDRPEAPDQPAQAAPEMDTVKINYQPFLSYAPVLIAYEEGYFSEQSIAIEFITLKRSVVGVPALAEGELDVLSGALNAGILNAIGRGAQLRLVADKGHIGEGPPPATALFMRKELVESGVLEDPSRLHDMKCAWHRDNVTAMFVEKALNRLGAETADMEMLYLPNMSRMESIAKGTLDMVSMTEPWLTRLKEAGNCEIIVPDYEVLAGSQFAGITFGPALLDERPEVGRRFMAAYLKGVRTYSEGKTPRNVEILAQHTKLEPELVKQAAWIAVRDDGRINVESIMAFQDWALKNELLDRRLSAEEFWEPTFVEYAAKMLDQPAD